MAQQQQQQQTWLFVATYFDPLPRLKRQYLLKYWPGSHFVEMTDVKTKKLFLKKSPAPPELSEKDMMIGSKILLYSRELEIVDYGDGYTRSTLQFQAQGTIFILPPETYTSWGKVVDSVLSSNFTLVRVKTVFMAQNIADSVCVALEQNMRLSASLSSGVSLILHVTGEDGIARGAALATSMSGPKSGGTILACTSGQQVSAITEILLDNRAVTNSSTLDSCTCCIIKPHAIKSQLFGKILDEIISQGYEVSAIQSVYFDRAASEEFLEVYKGVIPDFQDHVTQLCSGMSVAMELRAEDAVTTFRQTAGPWDVEMARELRPKSLRGMYGESNVRSAIHCTDLPVDAVAECEYCFRIISST